MNKANLIIEEVNKVIIGKEKVIRKVWMTILSGGHVLLEDVPGVGKTTMALAFSKALGLSYRRIQFTPDAFFSVLHHHQHKSLLQTIRHFLPYVRFSVPS